LQLDAFQLFQRIGGDAELRAKLLEASGAVQTQAKEILDGPVLPERIHQEAMKKLNAAGSGVGSRLPDGVTDVTSARQWQLSHPGDTSAAGSTVTNYLWLTQTVLRERLDQGVKQVSALTDELSKAKFELLPAGYQLEDYFPWRWHFWGIMASAALLSLGAPFWFNILKSLSSLRPALAKRIDETSAVAGAQAGGGTK